MSNIKVLIVEDEELYADQLEMLIEKLGYIHLKTVDNSVEALEAVKKESPDLILMDVNIHGDYDGVELSELIQKEQITPIIFITSLADDMTFKRIKRTQPIGYLLKPFNSNQLQRTIDLAVSQLSETESHGQLQQEEAIFLNASFWVKDKTALKKITLKEIVYIHAEGKYCTLYLKEKRFVLRSSLVKLLERFDNHPLFFQCHKSYVANLTHIESFDGLLGTIQAGKHEVPLSRRMKDELKNRLNIL